MKTPDITPAQLVSALVALLGAGIVLFKLDLSDAQRAAATTIIGTLVPLFWVLGDAIIRRARAQHLAALNTQTTITTAAPTTAASVGPAISLTTVEPVEPKRAPRRKKAES